MRLHRFFVQERIGGQTDFVINSAELENQVRRVFRLKENDSIIIFDGSGFDYECILGKMNSHRKGEPAGLRLYISTSKRSSFVPNRNIYLCASVVKKDTFEWIAQKATELGVTHIIPVISERSEKKSLNEERLKKISIEASEQSGRGTVPEISPLKTLNETIDFLNAKDIALKKVCFHTEGEIFNSKKFDPSSPVALFIGPEGGWSDSEIQMFHGEKIPVLTLGTQILRSETAVISTLSQFVFHK